MLKRPKQVIKRLFNMENTLSNKAKFCIRCREEKLLDEFYKHPRKDGLLPHCKSCHKRSVKVSLENSPNKESIKRKKNNKSLERYHNNVNKNIPKTSIEDLCLLERHRRL